MDDSPIQTALCVIGHPIGGNPAQFVALRALSALKLDWQFISFDVEPSQIGDAIRGIDSLGFCGAIVANPYQGQVASILSPADERPAEPHPDTPHPEKPWNDCLYRNEDNRLAAANVLAEAVRQVIETHVTRTGQPLGRCVCIGELSKLALSTIPILKDLPENRYVIAGEKLFPFADSPPTSVPEPLVVAEPATEQETMEPAPEPTLVIWALDSKPGKKSPSKPSTGSPSPAYIATFLAGLHPDSLVIETSGNSAAWLAIAEEHREQPLVLTTTAELEVMRLALAIRRWTAREPNQDVMREAIEEYLEI